MKVKEKIVIFVVLALLIFTSFARAHGTSVDVGQQHNDEFALGKSLVESGVSCSNLTNKELEAIGEYFMEQMHPGTQHEAMHAMMGLEEGSKEHEQFHIALAERLYCDKGITSIEAGEGCMAMMGFDYNYGKKDYRGGMMNNFAMPWMGFTYFWTTIAIIALVVLITILVVLVMKS